MVKVSDHDRPYAVAIKLWVVILFSCSSLLMRNIMSYQYFLLIYSLYISFTVSKVHVVYLTLTSMQPIWWYFGRQIIISYCFKFKLLSVNSNGRKTHLHKTQVNWLLYLQLNCFAYTMGNPTVCIYFLYIEDLKYVTIKF